MSPSGKSQHFTPNSMFLNSGQIKRLGCRRDLPRRRQRGSHTVIEGQYQLSAAARSLRRVSFLRRHEVFQISDTPLRLGVFGGQLFVHVWWGEPHSEAGLCLRHPYQQPYPQR